MKKILIICIVLVLSGCAGLQFASDVLDIVATNKQIPGEPLLVCDKDSAGTAYAGKICLKYSDGSYRWVKQ